MLWSTQHSMKCHPCKWEMFLRSKLHIEDILSDLKWLLYQVEDLGIGTVQCSTDLASLSYDLSDLIEVTAPHSEGKRQWLFHGLDLCTRSAGSTRAGTWRWASAQTLTCWSQTSWNNMRSQQNRRATRTKAWRLRSLDFARVISTTSAYSWSKMRAWRLNHFVRWDSTIKMF